jgi:hypothetical protein
MQEKPDPKVEKIFPGFAAVFQALGEGFPLRFSAPAQHGFRRARKPEIALFSAPARR